MKPGDVIVEINGVKVNTSEEIYNAVRTSDSLNAVVRRGEDLLTLNMTPEFTEWHYVKFMHLKKRVRNIAIVEDMVRNEKQEIIWEPMWGKIIIGKYLRR